MQITFHFFSSLRETTGVPACTVDVPDGATLASAVARLIVEFPALAGHQASWHFAVNQVQTEAETVLSAGDVVSIFPYIAGG